MPMGLLVHNLLIKREFFYKSRSLRCFQLMTVQIFHLVDNNLNKLGHVLL